MLRKRNHTTPKLPQVTNGPQETASKRAAHLQSGGHSLMAPPGPIPNPEVKHQHVDGSRTPGPARVDSCRS